ncbi:MAG TPA: HD-GYP domain-containing protein [Rhodocyclaceae bacterium]|nr:HD-GYP domain-containing protein [Rhodocyclaceae bacterium]
MTPLPIETRDPVDAVVRTAQYLAGIVSYEDLWPQLGRLVRRFYGADLVAFAVREPEGGIRFMHCEPACSGLEVAAEAVATVFESGFLTTETLALPDPHGAVLLPLGRERQRTGYVMLVAHRGLAAFSRASLDLYLALAGLIETTLDRIASQHRFLTMADNVPELLFELVDGGDQWRFGYASGGARAALGLPAEALVADAGLLFSGLATEDREALAAALAAGQPGQRLHLRLRWAGPDGALRYLLADALLATGEAGRPVWDGALRDVSEQVRLEEESRRNLVRLNKSMEDAIQAVAATIEKRDPYTAGHQRRVADLAGRLAAALGLPEDTIHGIRLTASIHDIGKIHVPAEILSYPGRLPEIEFALIRAHPEVGYEILKNVDFPWPVAEMVYQHHEHLDGSGYPRHLAGDGIMLGARIITVADVVEAIALYRPYRPGLGIATALEEIERYRGSRYDPAVVDACLRLFREEGYDLGAGAQPGADAR